MNFTREPIIETIVSPKDGYKLCIRNSKLSGAEEFFVDAVEIVSFGQALFFRGQERPKPFLVPVSDYEVFEVKETRVVLKNIAHDRNIKIGGGRDASLKSNKEVPLEKKEEVEEIKEPALAVSTTEVVPVEVKTDRKRDRRRSRRRRLAEEKRNLEKEKNSEAAPAEQSLEEEVIESSEVKVSPPSFAHLLPPPPVLISERLSQLRNKEAEASGALIEEERKEIVVEDASETTHSKIALEDDEEDFPF